MQEGVVEKVTRTDGNDYYTVMLEDGTGFGLGAEYGCKPQRGDFVRLHVYQDSRIRGISINRRELFYYDDHELDRRHAEQHAKYVAEKMAAFEEAKETLDKAYGELPDEFKRRIDRFRAGNETFRWEHESYEMSVCQDAVKMALAYWETFEVPAPRNSEPITHEEAEQRVRDWFKRFNDLNFEMQNYVVKTLTGNELYDGHSGNSWGMAQRLAYWYLMKPEYVVEEHGAMTALTGCEDYGCTHEGEEE
jgi:hypothetical protein